MTGEDQDVLVLVGGRWNANWLIYQQSVLSRDKWVQIWFVWQLQTLRTMCAHCDRWILTKQLTLLSVSSWDSQELVKKCTCLQSWNINLPPVTTAAASSCLPVLASWWSWSWSWPTKSPHTADNNNPSKKI